jgi:hypothetical protein
MNYKPFDLYRYRSYDDAVMNRPDEIRRNIVGTAEYAEAAASRAMTILRAVSLINETAVYRGWLVQIMNYGAPLYYPELAIARSFAVERFSTDKEAELHVLMHAGTGDELCRRAVDLVYGKAE